MFVMSKMTLYVMFFISIFFLRMKAHSAKHVFAIIEASVRLFVCLFVCHIAVLCQNNKR